MNKKTKTALIIMGYAFLALGIITMGLFLSIYLALNSLVDKSTLTQTVPTEVIHDVKAPGLYKYHPRTNFLILGSDNAGGISRTDVIIVASVDETNTNVALISLPRDTKIEVEEKTVKLNAIYPQKGLNATIKVVEEILNLPIHNYIKMDYQGFEKIINILGGVIIDIEMPMVWDDYAQNLHIRLMPGKKRLNGEQALHYVRFRNDGYGDVSVTDSGYTGRVARQQKFIEALVNELSRPSNLGKLPTLIPQLKDAIRTNLTPSEMVKWASLAQDAKGFQIKSFVLPGRATIAETSYWIYDQSLLTTIINEYFRVGKYGFSVGILNGSGSLEAGNKTAEMVRDKEFNLAGITQVTEYQYQKTTIQAAEVYEDAVKWLAAVINLKEYEWIKTRSPLGDVAILLGRDAVR